MTNVIYNIDIPDGPNNPSQDQPKMKTNTNSLKSLIEIDHVGFGNNQGGYHKIVRLIAQIADPVLVAGTGQLYSKTVLGDQQLFYESGTGIITQLTSGVIPVIGTAGTTSLSSGLIMKWGFLDGTHGGDNHFNGGDAGLINFPVAFPNACFNVFASAAFTNGNPPSATNTGTVAINSALTPALFGWSFASSSGSYTRFYWWALGN